MIFGELLQDICQFQIPFGHEQFLNQQIAGHKQDTVALLDEYLSNSAEQMRLAASRVAESEYILAAVSK